MRTKRLTRRDPWLAGDGERDLVSGPAATREPPSCVRAAATRCSDGARSVGRGFGSGSNAWPRPVSPWISLASLTLPSSGPPPGQTGYRPPRERQDGAGVALGQRNVVASDRPTPRSCSPGRQGVQQREGVVDARVDVEDERLRLLADGRRIECSVQPGMRGTYCSASRRRSASLGSKVELQNREAFCADGPVR